MSKGKYERKTPEFAKRKQIWMKGLTLRMFEHDVEDRETKESTLLCEIVKDYYRKNPPLGFRDSTR